MKAVWAGLLTQLYAEFAPELKLIAIDAVQNKLHEVLRVDAPKVIVGETDEAAEALTAEHEIEWSGSEPSADANELDPTADAVMDDSAYRDEDAFADGVMDSVRDLAVGAITTPAQVVEAVRGLVLMAGEVRKFEEAQITKRLDIARRRDVTIAKIDAQTNLLRDYLARSFDERSGNFDRLFGVVDEALATNNMEALALGLESVIRLADSSPFKDLRTIAETATALEDSDHEWEF